MKNKTNITIGFTAEIVFFALTGVYLAQGDYGYSIIAIIFAMMIAGYVGKLIEKDAIERYKNENKN